MKIGNSTCACASIAKARALRLAKSKAIFKINKKTSSKASSSSANSLLSALNRKNTSTSKYGTTSSASNALLKKDYTIMKNAADGLQEHASKLMASGENSLFGKAIPEESSRTDSSQIADSKKTSETETDIATETVTGTKKTKPTVAELAMYKDNVVKEINNFIDDYNVVLSKLNSIGGTVNTLYVKLMKNYVEDNKTALKNLGITQASNGILSVNQKTLKAADVVKIQKIFGTTNSFVDKVSTRCKNIESNADTTLAKLNKSSYSSNYNSYGNSNKNIGDSSYNARG